MIRLLFVLAVGLSVGVLYWGFLGRAQDVPGGLAPGQRLQCASYTPFRKGETPADFSVQVERLREDFALLASRVGCIRIYSMKGMQLIPGVAREFGLGVIAGAWVSRDDVDTDNELRLVIEMAARYPDVVRAVLVGNEVLLRRERTAAQLLGYMQRVRGQVQQPVSYGDVWDFWMQNPQIVDGADFVTIHLLPYWENSPTPVDAAIHAVEHAHDEIARAFPGKDILIGETGWPSEGRRREGAQPGRVSEARFIRGFVAHALEKGWQYNLIEAFDQPWKRGQEGAVGGYWGLFDASRHDKGLLSGPVSDVPQWRGLLAASSALFFVLLVLFRPSGLGGALVLALAANTVTTHLHLMSLYSRNLPESAWFIAQALAALACAAVLSRARDLRSAAHWQDAALGFALAFAAVEVVGLVFDARYRHFPVAVFLVPALAMLQLGLNTVPWRARGRVLGLLMLLGIPVMLWQETLLNLQALAWSVVVGVLAAGALRQSAQSRAGSAASASSAITAPGAP